MEKGDASDFPFIIFQFSFFIENHRHTSSVLPLPTAHCPLPTASCLLLSQVIQQFLVNAAKAAV